jgi:hypothetical protein
MEELQFGWENHTLSQNERLFVGSQKLYRHGQFEMGHYMFIRRAKVSRAIWKLLEKILVVMGTFPVFDSTSD